MDLIITPLLAVLKWLFSLTGNLGWAIIVFTVLVRIAMLPLTIKQLKSQKKMQILQPKLREIQRKYAKDRERQTQETFKLYKEHGSNPVSGCLPLLLTLPILIGVWRAVSKFPTTGLTDAQLSFLWIPRLSPAGGTLQNVVVNIHDVSHSLSVLVPQLTGNGRDPLYILPILAVALQFVTSQMAMPRNPDPQQAQMNRVMMFMPLMFGWFYFTIPAGATLYSVTGSLIQMVQQYFTTGFGALPRFLPFLPEKTGFLTQSVPATVEESGGETVAEEPARRDFWTALGKLNEPLDADEALPAFGASDLTTEQAIEEARSQLRRPPKHARRRGSKPNSSIGG